MTRAFGCLFLGLISTSCQRGSAAPSDPDAGVQRSASATQLPRSEFSHNEDSVSRTRAGAETGANIRCVYTHVAVAIDGDIARTTVTDVLVNETDAESSTGFSFPLPSDATVVSFADFPNGSPVLARAQERESARAAYDEAIARGAHAALGEASVGNRFSMTLAPIAAHQSRRVELVYTQTARSLGGESSVVFPKAHFDHLRPALLEYVATLSGSNVVQQAKLEGAPTSARVVFSGPAARASFSTLRTLAQDLVFSWSTEHQPLELALRAERAEANESAFVLGRFAFHELPSTVTRTPQDIIVVIDHSLSMAGAPLTRSKAMAREVIESLTPNDRIALVALADSVASWPTLLPANDANRARALSEIDALRAVGSSHTAAGLDQAVALIDTASHRDTTLVIASDGQPTDTGTLTDDGIVTSFDATKLHDVKVIAALFNYAEREQALVAALPGANVAYVADGEPGERTLHDLVGLAFGAALEDVRVEVIGATADSVVPKSTLSEHTSIILGREIRFAFRSDAREVRVRVHANLHGQAIVREATVAIPTLAHQGALPQEWARIRIADLEQEWSMARAAGADSEAARTEKAALREAIIALGTRYQLATRFTSFVADDSLGPDRIRPGDPEIRVRAPVGARLFARLPWGEQLDLAYREEEQRYFGRFLVPRGTADGLYRVPVFIEQQGTLSLHTSLRFMVDSHPPEFRARVQSTDECVQLIATPMLDTSDARGNTLSLDAPDLQRLILRVGRGSGMRLLPLTQSTSGDLNSWQLCVPLEWVGSHAELVATDHAGNSSTSRVILMAPATMASRSRT